MIDQVFSRLLSLPQLAQQLIAIATVVLFALVGGGLISAAVRHLQSQQAVIQSFRTSAGIIEAVVAQRQYLPTPSVEEGLQSSLIGQTLMGENSALARAALQSRFSALAQSHQVEVVSVGNARDLNVDGLTYLGLTVNLQGPMRSIHDTVMYLETTAPQLFLQDLTVRAISVPYNDDDLAARETELALQFQVYGLFLPTDEPGFVPSVTATESVVGQ